MPKFQKIPKISWNARHTSLAVGVSFGLCVSFSSPRVVNAQASEKGGDKLVSVRTSHGKEVYNDYTITGELMLVARVSLYVNSTNKY